MICPKSNMTSIELQNLRILEAVAISGMEYLNSPIGIQVFGPLLILYVNAMTV